MTTGRDAPSHRLFATMYDPVMWGLERTMLPDHPERLARDLSGHVLDLGVGTGAMFPYFDSSRDEVEFYGIEPDPHMRKRAERKAASLGFDIDIRGAGAEELPFDDDVFDVVIASMVFCTIPDIESSLDEVARILKKGGQFRFLAHVQADGGRGRIQELATPVWRRLAGGCHLDRETPTVIADRPAFNVADLERIDMGVGLVRPFVQGTVTVREDA